MSNSTAFLSKKIWGFYPGAKFSGEHMNITVSTLSTNEKIMLIEIRQNF